jgi:hypothetical protein
LTEDLLDSMAVYLSRMEREQRQSKSGSWSAAVGTGPALLRSGCGLHLLPPLTPLESALVHVDFSKNSLTELPPSITILVQLEQLRLSHNCLAALPALPSSLTLLDLGYNLFTAIPTCCTALVHLRSLSLKWNSLRGVSTVLDSLSSLVSLSLKGNALITDAFSGLLQWENLTALERLDLAENRLESLPPLFRYLVLFLFCNKSNIYSILICYKSIFPHKDFFFASKFACRLPKLRKLQLKGNPLPPELQKDTVEGIMSVLTETYGAAEADWRNVKLMILGNEGTARYIAYMKTDREIICGICVSGTDRGVEGTGKTSLLRTLKSKAIPEQVLSLSLSCYHVPPAFFFPAPTALY